MLQRKKNTFPPNECHNIPFILSFQLSWIGIGVNSVSETTNQNLSELERRKSSIVRTEVIENGVVVTDKSEEKEKTSQPVTF